VLRELLGDYLSFDADSVGKASVIPVSTFDDVVAVHSPFAPFTTRNDSIFLSEEGVR